MRVEPKTLVKKLTVTATRFLEEAVGRAYNGGYYEIVPEHMLMSMLEPDDGDCALILRQFDQDRGRLAIRVEKVLEGLHTGNGSKPVLSENLFQWFEDAWLLGSLELGDVQLRSGVLLAQWIANPSRYSGESFPELEDISSSELNKKLPEILSRSAEAVHVMAAASVGGKPGSPAAAPGAPSKDGGALKRFTVSFTEKARAGKIDPVFGRHREIRQMIDVLARRRKNNPIIVGEAGVGKTALVEGLALAIAQKDVPESLRETELVGLDLGLLQAGAGVKGEFENRLKAVISEIKASPKPIIMFIDEAHTMIGAGGPTGGSDAANLLKPELARGELRTVAATTWSEYKKYFEKDAALERRFQPIKVDEPSEEEAIGMLRGLRPTYEQSHSVSIRDEAIVAAVRLSQRYISGRQLPDKAVDLLDTAAARVRLEQEAKPEMLIGVEAELATLERQRDALTRDQAAGHDVDAAELQAVSDRIAATNDRLASLKSRWETERNAIAELNKAQKEGDAGATPDAAAMKTAREEVRKKISSSDPLVHAEVDADLVARVVASWTGIPVGKMKSEAISSALTLEQKLGERVHGQSTAVRVVAETVRVAHAGLRNPSTPVGVLLFVGPSGVGKTETALALADLLYGGERFMTTINMSEFQEKHTVSRLIGSPPGYVGFGQGGVLTEAVRHRPYSVVLLDECEKADLEVMNLFYQVFDKGMLSDGEGRQIDFRNTIVILTSNLASDAIVDLYSNGSPSSEEVASTIRPILSRHFKPALLARMTIVPFAPMAEEALRAITQMKLAALGRRITQAHGADVVIEPVLLDEIVRRCSESETGARNIDHILRAGLMPEISRALLERMAAGTSVSSVSLGVADGAWKVEIPS